MPTATFSGGIIMAKMIIRKASKKAASSERRKRHQAKSVINISNGKRKMKKSIEEERSGIKYRNGMAA